MARSRNLPDKDFLPSPDMPGAFQEPQFLLSPPESLLRRVVSNLVACWVAPRKGVPEWAFAPMFRSSYLPRSKPTRSLLASALLHTGLLACLVNIPHLPRRLSGPERTELPRREHTILWYSKSDLLPPVSPLKAERRERAKARTSSPRHAPQPTRAVQAIISKPPVADNRRQRIVQPDLPDVQIRTEIRIPNIVVTKPKLVPPPPALEVQRQLAEIQLPSLPPPAVSALPAPPPSKIEELKRKLSEIPVAATTVSPIRKLEVPQPSTPVVLGPKVAPGKVVGRAPQTEPQPPVIQPQARTESLPSLIAVGVTPAPPNERFTLPSGNRAGEFATSPQGAESAPTAPPADGTGLASGEAASLGFGQQEVADIRAPQLSISGGVGGTSAEAPAPGRTSPPPASSRSPDLARLLAKATRPSLLPNLPREHPLEPMFFGERRVYTLYINMPNLSSATGSWVLRFAQPDGEASEKASEVSSPVAVRKVDPQYEPSAIRAHVEGTVTLAAQILRDGSVANIRVVNSLDPRLDLNAIQAFTRWQFEPAKRNGNPVDLDVLVQIPFRLPAL